MDDLEKCKKALSDISKILDSLEYECRARIYTLDDEEFSWIFYCRDLADLTLKECQEKLTGEMIDG